MRVDHSDLVDKTDGTQVNRRARSAFDDPDVADRDLETTVEGDDLPSLPPVLLDSALRVERAAAYRAVVDAAYQQYAIDHGDVHQSIAGTAPELLRGSASLDVRLRELPRRMC